MMIFLRNIVCLLVVGLSAPFAMAQQPMVLPVDQQKLVVETKNGDVTFAVEIAMTSQQREQGLMYREDFPDDRAMLFKFDQEDMVMMWMENTPRPLDIIFMNSNGQIVSIARDTTPYSRDIISSRKASLYALEVNAGIVAKNHIAIGDKVIHQAICGQCEDGQ